VCGRRREAEDLCRMERRTRTCLDFDALSAARPVVRICALALVVPGMWREQVRGEEARGRPVTCSGTLASHGVVSGT
jgi:hypothetical protein